LFAVFVEKIKKSTNYWSSCVNTVAELLVGHILYGIQISPKRIDF